jgi:fumarate hydratase subunit beta
MEHTHNRQIANLKSGDLVYFSGILYTARDQAHKKLAALIENDKPLPLDLKGQIIYYCGPTAASPGRAIGSCGPTTSQRMDDFVEPLLKKGLSAVIGKGRRTKKVRDLMRRHKSVYFLAPSGCGALLAQKVVSSKTVAFSDLGPEAIRELVVKRFPLVVAIDSRGKSIYPDL